MRDLTEGSQGNAVGIGLADYTTERLISKIDKEVTRINSILGSCPEKGRIPIAFRNDRETILAGLSNAGVYRLKEGRIVWIKNTLALRYLRVSEPLIEEVRVNKKLKIGEGPFLFPFDNQKNLPFGTFPE